jgi:hypothetical protein
LSVHVEEIQTRVVPVPSSGDQATGGEPRLGTAEETWAATYRLLQREGWRTAARDFDD